jgi:radical SAM protein with 4Fe4S-binding SPASM domain
MPYYKLNNPYMLRGWEDFPYGLVNTQKGEVRSITEFAYDTLRLCNGKIDFALPFTADGRESFIKYLLEKGIITHTEKTDEIESWQIYRPYPNIFINKAHWLITGKCNMKCRHCYVSAPHALYGELSHEDTMKIAEGIIRAGIPSVELSGGEPLVRDDFLELAAVFSRSRTAISYIYTNGLLVSQELLDKLLEYGQKPSFQISFDGPGHHDWMRGTPGAADTALKAIELLVKNNFYVHVGSTFHRESIGKLEETMNLLVEKGVSSWKAGLVTRDGEWKNERDSLNVSSEELYTAFLDFIPQYFNAGSPLSIELGFFFRCEKGSRDYTIPVVQSKDEANSLDTPVCASVRTKINILPDGKLVFCITAPGNGEEGGATNLLLTPLRDALHDSPWFRKVDTRVKTLFEKNKTCSECEYRLACRGGCRSRAILENGSFFGVDPDACAFFKGKWEEKIKNALKNYLEVMGQG